MNIFSYERLGITLAGVAFGTLGWWWHLEQSLPSPESAPSAPVLAARPSFSSIERSPDFPVVAPPSPVPGITITTPRISYCGKPEAQCRCASLPPPPVDSPFGAFLYANWRKPTVALLPAHVMADDLNAPNGDGERDVEIVGAILDEYRRAFGAMPVGEANDEIVRRLQGQNPKGIAVLPAAHPAINGQGELLDRWGTPYRFHPESSWQVTVQSAGPDRKMWTNDDTLSSAESLAAVGR